FWKASDAVMLADAPAPPLIAQKAERTLGDPSLRSRLAEAGARWYRQRFHPQNTIDALRAAARRDETDPRNARFSEHYSPEEKPVLAEASTPVATVVMLVNGDESSAMGVRARALGAGLTRDFDV